MKLIGNGVDITSVQRMEQLCTGTGFEERYFTEGERAYASQYRKPYEHFAGFFCAKEAFSKALGTGIRDFALKDVEVSHDEMGRPFLLFHHDLATRIQQQRLSFSLSISHCAEYAVANVIAIQL